MRNFDINLGPKREKVVIRSVKILEETPDCMIIADWNGKKYRLEKNDFSSLHWENIKAGHDCEIILEKKIVAASIHGLKIPRELLGVAIPIHGYASWCRLCGKIAIFEVEEGDDPSVVIDKIVQKHTMDSPKCDSIVCGRFCIIDHYFVEQKEIAQMLKNQRQRAHQI